jgi:circadian clock protein KaiC
VSDCVIFLDHRVVNQVATRRLRVVKYRGSAHGTNEYPTLIDKEGLSVLPISSLGLAYPVTSARVSSGIARLDEMLGGKGYYKGSSILVTGPSGSGKSSISAAFANSLCERGGRCLYWASEESPEQIVRNMASIGMDLRPEVRSGRLHFHAVRPSIYGLESHLVALHNLVERLRPQAVVIDPITNLDALGNENEIKAMITRIIDFLKTRQITAMFTTLVEGGAALEESSVGVSSLVDTWLLLRMAESAGERNRLLYVVKSRGMAHSNQMREFVMGPRGIALVDVYAGPGIVHTGSERLNQEARDRASFAAQQQAAADRERKLAEESAAVAAQIAALQARLGALKAAGARTTANEKTRLDTARRNRASLARARGGAQ